MSRETSTDVATLASRGLRNPNVLTHEQIKAICASALAQREADDSAMVAELADVLAEAVELYGKPGGPWNVPSDPGGWISRAKDALAKARARS